MSEWMPGMTPEMVAERDRRVAQHERAPDEPRKQQWRALIAVEFETYDYPGHESDRAEMQAAAFKNATERASMHCDCAYVSVALNAVERVFEVGE